MATNIYPVDIFILFKNVGSPKCKISVDDQRRDLIIDKETEINIPLQGRGTKKITIEHYGKEDLDPSTALIIEQIKFNEIISPQFVWQGIYYPTYPKHLTGANELKYHNYLGWNGIWSLEFTLPIYTWIHKVENLGWIYD
jgi:hypothetical protein